MKPVNFTHKIDKKLFKTISLGAVIISLILTLAALPFELYKYSALNLFTALLCAISYYAYQKKWHNIALALLFVGVPIIMLIYVYLFGNISAHFYLIPAAVAFTFLTKRKKYWNEITWIIVTCLFILSEVILYKNGKFDNFTQLENYLHFTNQVGALLLVYIVSRFFRNTHEEYRLTLENNNAIKEKLISVVSHDLRSPINSIKEMLVLFKNEDISKEDFERMINKLTDEVDKTSYMLDNTLLWIKNQLNAADPHYEEIKVVDFIKSTVNQYKHQIDEKGISLNYNLDLDNSVLITSDSEMLKLILRNIISNAIKFTPVKDGEIVITGSGDETQVNLGITDNGKGMNDSQVSNLFNMQEKLSSGTKGELGFGLGLNLAKNYAEKIDVAIKVESEVNKGSTFYLQIPSLHK